MCFSEASKAAIGWRMNGFGELDWGAFSLDYDLLQLVICAQWHIQAIHSHQ